MSNCVSIVVRAYKRVETLMATLESIGKLTRPGNIEIETMVVISSNDPNKQGILRALEESPIPVNVIEIPINSATRAWNEGIRRSGCEYVMVIPDDVYLNQDTLTNSLNLLKDDVIAVTYPAYPAGIDDIKAMPFSAKLHHLRYLGIRTTGNTVLLVTVFKRDALLKVGLYREDMGPPLTLHEDWELGSRITKGGFRVLIDGTLKQLHMEDAGNAISNNEAAASRSSMIMSVIRSYVGYYIRSGWWSMLQVLKASPPTQLLEYSWYFTAPILLIILLTLGQFLYASLLVLLTAVVTDALSLARGYYKLLSIRERLTYPLVMYITRTIRMYSFIVGLVVNKLWGRSRQRIH